MVVCLVSLGANLGERAQTLDEAVAQLGKNPTVHDLSESPRLETVAIGGPSGQPAFLNSVVRFVTDAEPPQLLAILQEIEHSSQRDRTKRWAARTLDLDLLAYGDQILREPTLCVPHPRMSFRPFVLEPAVAMAPDWQHPELGITLAELWQTLRQGRNVVRLEGGDHAVRMAVGQLLRAEFPGIVVETRGSCCQPFPRLTIDLLKPAQGKRQADQRKAGFSRWIRTGEVKLLAQTSISPPSASLAGPSGPRLRLADCSSDHWRDEVRAAVGCVWPELTE